jgi:hypothetical protein
MASIQFVSKRYVGGGASWMYTFRATYHWGRYLGGGTIEVGPYSNDNEAREDAQGQADEIERNTDPTPIP